jgi:hypothetical protein
LRDYYRVGRNRREFCRIRFALVEAGIGVRVATGIVGVVDMRSKGKTLVFRRGAFGVDLVLDYALTLVNNKF